MTQQWRIVRDALAGELAGRVYRSGERLPSEHELARDFQVSRNTVRRAFLSLSQEGLIRIVNGRGSFVAHEGIVYEIDATSRFYETLLAAGAKPRRAFLDGRSLPADDRLAELLEVSVGTELVEIESLVSIRDLPVVLSRRVFPAELIPNLLARYREQLSITRVLAEAGLGELLRQSTTVGARLPTPKEAETLAMPTNSPVLVADGVGRLSSGLMAEVNVSLVPAHLVRFKFRGSR